MGDVSGICAKISFSVELFLAGKLQNIESKLNKMTYEVIRKTFWLDMKVTGVGGDILSAILYQWFNLIWLLTMPHCWHCDQSDILSIMRYHDGITLPLLFAEPHKQEPCWQQF